MALLILLVTMATASGGLAMRAVRRERIERLRDQARLRVIEGQLAAMRTLLRIEAAEHMIRTRLAEAQRRNLSEQDW